MNFNARMYDIILAEYGPANAPSRWADSMRGRSGGLTRQTAMMAGV